MYTCAVLRISQEYDVVQLVKSILIDSYPQEYDPGHTRMRKPRPTLTPL